MPDKIYDPVAALEEHRKHLRASRWKPPKMRSTLTASTAESILPYIEVALTGKDVLVEFGDFYVRPLTLYHKICDAFQWYIRYDDKIGEEKRTAISALRALVHFPYDEGQKGVWIRHKRSSAPPTVSGRPPVESREVVTKLQLDALKWREDFMAWVESGKPGEIFSRTEGVLLSAEDMEFIKAVAGALECKQVEVTTTTILCSR